MCKFEFSLDALGCMWPCTAKYCKFYFFTLELNNCINSVIENLIAVFHFTLLFGGRGGDHHIEVQAPDEGGLSVYRHAHYT